MAGLFRQAQRRKAKLRLGIDGPSGSGKTFSALEIAYGLTHDWEKIALIDTEHGSGDLYADKGPYAVLTFDPPYQVKRYIKAIHAAEAEGFEVVIVDSLSHAWAGTGGLLDKHDAATKASSSHNSYVAWREVTPEHNELIDTILNSPCHVIATMRTKVEYSQEEDDHGRKVVRKLGTKPIQREGMDYEFTVVLDLTREHVATASKTRISEFDDWCGVPTSAVGEELLEWLNTGSESPAPAMPAAMHEPPPAEEAGNGKPKTISADQIASLIQVIESKGRTVEGVFATMNKKGICPGGPETLALEKYEGVMATLAGLKPAKGAESPAEPVGAAESPTQSETAQIDEPVEPPAGPVDPTDMGGVEFGEPDEDDDPELSDEDRAFLAETDAAAKAKAPAPDNDNPVPVEDRPTVTQRKRVLELFAELEAAGQQPRVVIRATIGTDDPARMTKSHAKGAIGTLEAMLSGVKATGQGALA